MLPSDSDSVPATVADGDACTGAIVFVIWPVALLVTVMIYAAASDNDFHGALALLFLGALLVWQLDRPRK